MPDRSRLAPTLWIAAALLVLALGSVTPAGTVAPGIGPDHAAGLAPCLDPSASTPEARLVAAPPAEAALETAELTPEVEEQDRADARDESRTITLLPGSYRRVTRTRITASRSTPSLYPLRC